MNGPVHPYVHLYVRHAIVAMFFSLYYHEFIEAISINTCDVHAKGLGQRSKVKVTEVKINFAPVCEFPDRNSRLNKQMPTK